MVVSTPRQRTLCFFLTNSMLVDKPIFPSWGEAPCSFDIQPAPSTSHNGPLDHLCFARRQRDTRLAHNHSKPSDRGDGLVGWTRLRAAQSRSSTSRSARGRREADFGHRQQSGPTLAVRCGGVSWAFKVSDAINGQCDIESGPSRVVSGSH